jgi:hypothetical protein
MSVSTDAMRRNSVGFIETPYSIAGLGLAIALAKATSVPAQLADDSVGIADRHSRLLVANLIEQPPWLGQTIWLPGQPV